MAVLEGAWAGEMPLRLEQGRVAEGVALLDLGLAPDDARVRVGIAAHDHVADLDLRAFGDDVGDLRRRLVGRDFFLRLHLHLGVAAIGVVGLQGDRVGALELRVQRIAGTKLQSRQLLPGHLFVPFDSDRGDHRLGAFRDREVDHPFVSVRGDDRRSDLRLGEGVQAVERLEGVAVRTELRRGDTSAATEQAADKREDAAARRDGHNVRQRFVRFLRVSGERHGREAVLRAWIDLERRRPDVGYERALGIDRGVEVAALLIRGGDVFRRLLDHILAISLAACEREEPADESRLGTGDGHAYLRSDGRGITQRHQLSSRVIGGAQEANLGLAEVVLHEETAHAVSVAPGVVDAVRASWTAAHPADELLRRIGRGVALDNDLTDMSAVSPRDVERDDSPARGAVETRLRIDRRLKVAVARELLLHGHRAVVDRIQGEDVAAAEVDVALRLAALVSAEAIEVNLGHSVVEREHDRDGHAARAAIRGHPHVAEVARGEERLDRLLDVANGEPFDALEADVLLQWTEIEVGVSAQ